MSRPSWGPPAPSAPRRRLASGPPGSPGPPSGPGCDRRSSRRPLFTALLQSRVSMERTTGGQGVVMGVILILIGIIYPALEFIPRLPQIDVAHYGWPVFVIVPGLVPIGVARTPPVAHPL